jgi:hypothetical protein
MWDNACGSVLNDQSCRRALSEPEHPGEGNKESTEWTGRGEIVISYQMVQIILFRR